MNIKNHGSFNHLYHHLTFLIHFINNLLTFTLYQSFYSIILLYNSNNMKMSIILFLQLLCLFIFYSMNTVTSFYFQSLKLQRKFTQFQIKDKLSNDYLLDQSIISLTKIQLNPLVPKNAWDFLDDIYLITTIQSQNSNRFNNTKEQLHEMNLIDRVNIRVFEADPIDRVKGCYTSHIKVLQEIQSKYQQKKNYKVLILEDNLEITNAGRQSLSILQQIASFTNQNSFDVFYLAYMMYVPGLSLNLLSKQSTIVIDPNDEYHEYSNNIVQLIANNESSVGTSSYIISKTGIDAILQKHSLEGYTQAIPNIMADLFPMTRYACYPMIFHRAGSIGSLVNPQLDDFRKVMFHPIIYSTWEKLMVSSGLQTNQLFPFILISLIFLMISSIGLATLSITSNELHEKNIFTNIFQFILLIPLGIGLWGASLFQTGNKGRGFAKVLKE